MNSVCSARDEVLEKRANRNQSNLSLADLIFPRLSIQLKSLSFEPKQKNRSQMLVRRYSLLYPPLETELAFPKISARKTPPTGYKFGRIMRPVWQFLCALPGPSRPAAEPSDLTSWNIGHIQNRLLPKKAPQSEVNESQLGKGGNHKQLLGSI